jgi:hypothetical protein
MSTRIIDSVRRDEPVHEQAIQVIQALRAVSFAVLGWAVLSIPYGGALLPFGIDFHPHVWLVAGAGTTLVIYELLWNPAYGSLLEDIDLSSLEGYGMFMLTAVTALWVALAVVLLTAFWEVLAPMQNYDGFILFVFLVTLLVGQHNSPVKAPESGEESESSELEDAGSEENDEVESGDAE